MPPQRLKLVFNLAGRRSGKLRRETLEGKVHLVAPAAILVEGVIEGSGGALLYLNEENGKDPDSWNHMPVVVYHPKQNGVHISARTPEVLNTSKIGLLLNTRHEGDKLYTEVWADEDKTREVDERVYNALVNEEPMEISTGLNADVEESAGEWNGKKYKGIVRNHRPDHLAILPDLKGACSLKDGAGLFANSAIEIVDEKDETFKAVEKIKEPTPKKPKQAILANTLVNDMSLSDVQSAVCQALCAKYQKPGYSWNGWVQDVFDGFVVYYMEGKLYSQDYTNKDGVITITGEPSEVVRSVEYKQVANGQVIGNSSDWQFLNPEERKIPMAFDKKAHVTALVANGQIEEKDRATYEALDEKVLQGIKVVEKTPAPAPTPAPIANATPPADPFTPAERQMFNRLIANEKSRKSELVVKITNAQVKLNVPENKRFKPEFLANKEVEELEAWATTLETQTKAQEQDSDMFVGQSIYAGANGGPINNAANDPILNEGPPIMPELDFTPIK